MRDVILIISLFLFPLSAIADNPKLKVGVSLPLTGSASTYGTDLKNVFTLANEKLGKGRFELIFGDDKCDPREAVNVAQKFVNIDKVKFVIGLPCSGSTLASAPVYEKAKVLVISAFAGSPEVTRAGDYIFRTRPSDVESSRLLYNFVTKKHSKIGLIVEQTDYALGLAGVFNKLAGSDNLVVEQEEFLTGSTDLRSMLLRMRAKKLDAVVLFTQTERSLSVAVKQIHEIRWSVPKYGSLFPGNASFIEIAKEAADGIIFSTLAGAYESSSARTRALFKDFVSRFGPLNSFDAGFECGYNAFAALVAASGSEDPKSYLYSKSIEGIGGKFKFDSNGDLVGMNFVMRKIQGGKVVQLNKRDDTLFGRP